MKNIFTSEVSGELIHRINKLESTTTALWGKMSVDQMLAHCNVTYEMVFEAEKHSKPNAIVRFILKTFVKSKVVSDKAYTKNGQTAPQFLIKESKNFDSEKERLIAYINKTNELGAGYFDNKESLSFGKLSKEEWNNMFYKHLDHHLSQFGV